MTLHKYLNGLFLIFVLKKGLELKKDTDLPTYPYIPTYLEGYFVGASADTHKIKKQGQRPSVYQLYRL